MSSGHKIYDVLIKKRGYQADDLCLSLIVYTFSIYIFVSATFLRIKTARFMYKRIHVHAPIRLRRCISVAYRQKLSWELLNFGKLYKLCSDK